MVNHLKTFVAKQNLDIKLLINLGMGGPTVNNLSESSDQRAKGKVPHNLY